MEKNFRNSPLIQAVTRAYQEPEKGLPALTKMIASAEKDGRSDDAHVLMDTFVGAACRSGRHLGTAERLARKLVAQQPDRHHLQHLAQVLDLRGNKRDAAEARRRAKQVADEHMTAEVAEIIAQAERDAQSS